LALGIRSLAGVVLSPLCLNTRSARRKVEALHHPHLLRNLNARDPNVVLFLKRNITANLALILAALPHLLLTRLALKKNQCALAVPLITLSTTNAIRGVK
jgi:hypothetical protein